MPLAYRRLLGFDTAWGTQVTWIFFFFRVCSRTLLRMSRCAMTCWIVISASALHRWALPFQGPFQGSKFSLHYSLGTAGVQGVCGLSTRFGKQNRLSWGPGWSCGAVVWNTWGLSLFLASTAQAQAELHGGCIQRLAVLAQNETISGNKLFHFGCNNICGAEVVAVLWRSVSVFKLVPC